MDLFSLLAEWEQSQNIWLSSLSLLRWENILNHFLQNLLSNNLKKGEILSFWQTSFLNFRVEKLFSSRSKNGTGNGVSRFRRMDKRQLWEKLLSHVAPCTFYVLTIIYEETIFYLRLGCLLTESEIMMNMRVNKIFLSRYIEAELFAFSELAFPTVLSMGGCYVIINKIILFISQPFLSYR